MFIPRGKPIHENLSTRYVLVDELVAELGEENFSGTIEIVLPERTGHILFAGGRVAAATEKRGDQEYARSTVAAVTAQSRAERGRLSVYRYAEPVAKALSNLLRAEPLYRRLSSEFADLQKMVVKFMREADRQWFIQVEVEGSTALVFIDDGNYVVVTPAAAGSNEPAENSEAINRLALQELVDRCHRSGAIFDVSFLNPNAVVEGEPAPEPVASEKSADQRAPVTENQEEQSATQVEASPPEIAEPGNEEALAEAVTEGKDEPIDTLVESEPEPGTGRSRVAAGGGKIDQEDELSAPPFAVEDQLIEDDLLQAPPAEQVLPTRELMAMAGMDDRAKEEFKMAEGKRLLSDIARSLEEVTRLVEQRDDFPMHLRAGQLKVADQYPFLDPFGSEFEYIEGEIVFVGVASLEDFVAGVSNALRYAMTNALQVSANPPRLRVEVVRKLKQLYDGNREEFNRYGLDLTVEEITGVQMTS